MNALPEKDLDVVELFGALWAGRWLVGGFTVLAAVVAVVFALSQPNVYRSTVLLAPTEQSTGGLSDLIQSYGGLASIAGLSLPQANNSSKSVLAKEMLSSRLFVTNFIDKHDLLPFLFAAKSWDESSREVVFDDAIYDSKKKKWVREMSPPRQSRPDAEEAYEAFTKLIQFQENAKTKFLTISIDHKSPDIAKLWLDLLIIEINETLKQKDIDDATKSIAFLNEQVKKNNISALDNVFFGLIESQIQTVMLANVRQQYVFTVIDPAVVPITRHSPNRALISIAGTVLGGVLSCIFLILRHFYKDWIRPV